MGKTDDPKLRSYYKRLVDYLENNVDILQVGQGLSTRYNNLDEPDYGRLRSFKDFLRRNFEIIAFTTTIVSGLAATFDFAQKVGAMLALIFTAIETILINV